MKLIPWLLLQAAYFYVNSIGSLVGTAWVCDDDDSGCLDRFVEAGFSLSTSPILLTPFPPPAPPPPRSCSPSLLHLLLKLLSLFAHTLCLNSIFCTLSKSLPSLDDFVSPLLRVYEYDTIRISLFLISLTESLNRFKGIEFEN
jgi:hypothetical protein